MLSFYQLNHRHIFEPCLSYIPIQCLPNNTFGFSFRVVKEKFYIPLAYSNKNRKFYKNDQIKFNFADNSVLEFKLLSGSIKDENGLNISIYLIKPKELKLFLFSDLEGVEINSKRNEIGFITSDLESTLEYYNIRKEFYQNTVKYLTEDILREYLKDWPGNDYSKVLDL